MSSCGVGVFLGEGDSKYPVCPIGFCGVGVFLGEGESKYPISFCIFG